jgi:hypothetical protein
VHPFSGGFHNPVQAVATMQSHTHGLLEGRALAACTAAHAVAGRRVTAELGYQHTVRDVVGKSCGCASLQCVAWCTRPSVCSLVLTPTWSAGILFMQLLLTTAVCAVFMSTTGVKEYMTVNTWPLWTSMGVSFGVLIAMMCNVSLARTFPHNYLLLTLFTAAESVMIGTVCMVRSTLSFFLSFMAS